MAKYLNHIDLSKNQLQNAVVHPLGTAPANPVDGQVYYNTTNGNKSIYVYDAELSQWKSISGDITGVAQGTYINITNADGPVPTITHADTSRTDTTSTDAPAYGGTFEAVTGVTTNAQGHVTAIDVSTVTIPASDNTDTTYDISVGAGGANSSTIDLNAGGSGSGTDSITIQGTDNGVTVTESGDIITVGLQSDITVDGLTVNNNVLISGDLEVVGTVTTVNETVKVVENNTIEFEGTTANDFEIKLTGGDPTADHTVALPDASGTIALLDDISQLATAAALIDVSAMGNNTTASFTHSLASKNLIVQMYDVTTGEVVFADVDHTSINAISIIFAQTPTNDIRVVVIDAKNSVADSTVTYS